MAAVEHWSRGPRAVRVVMMFGVFLAVQRLCRGLVSHALCVLVLHLPRPYRSPQESALLRSSIERNAECTRAILSRVTELYTLKSTQYLAIFPNLIVVKAATTAQTAPMNKQTLIALTPSVL